MSKVLFNISRNHPLILLGLDI